MMRRTLATVVLVASVFVWPHSAQPKQVGGAEPASREEYDVYSAVINEIYAKQGGQLFVIRDHTVRVDCVTEKLLNSTINGLALKQFEADKAHGQADFFSSKAAIERQFDGSMVSSLCDKQRREGKLQNGLRVSIPTHHASQAELDEVSANGRVKWKGFYSRYRDSSGLLEFSRVAFDAKKTMALVYVRLSRSPALRDIWDDGHYLLMKRTTSGWALELAISEKPPF